MYCRWKMGIIYSLLISLGSFCPFLTLMTSLNSNLSNHAAGVLVVDCSTGCLRMISEVPPIVRFLSSHHEFSVTFCLHLKKQVPTATPFTIDAAITRIDWEQVKAFLRTNAQSQGPQGNVSSVVVEDETRIFGRNPRSASKVWSTAFEVVQT
jgi:hypothetical protein